VIQFAWVRLGLNTLRVVVVVVALVALKFAGVF
jgi:hypothetical protein